MNSFTFGTNINGYEDGTIAKYTLSDDMAYYDAAYRILKKNENGSFVECHKIKYNGQLQFVYEIENLHTINELIGRCSSTQCNNIINVIRREIAKIKTMGFIQMDTIETNIERIYFSNNFSQAHFICVPIILDISKNRVEDFDKRINDSLQELVSLLGVENNTIMNTIDNMPAYVEQTNNIKLVCLNAPIQPIIIDRPQYVIGKSNDCNYILQISTSVSRHHCCVLSENGGFKIEDLNSLNGTFVNGQRLLAKQAVTICNGDRIRMANVEFEVKNN